MLRAWHVVRRHHLSLLSAVVLAVALVVAMTSDSISHESGPTLEPATDRPPVATVAASTPPRRRAMLNLYLLQSEQQRQQVVSAINGDALARISGPNVTEYVLYLLAGTPEDESAAIDRINFEVEVAAEGGFDVRVIDLRRDAIGEASLE
jgi:hypothetical protein